MVLTKLCVKVAGAGVLVGGLGWLGAHRSQPCRMEEGFKGEGAQGVEFWTWGNGKYVPQPDFRTQFSNFIPLRKIGVVNQTDAGATFESGLPRFATLIFRESKAVGVTDSGEVFAYDNEINPSFIRRRTTFQIGERLIDETQLIKNLRPLRFPARAKTVGITNKYLWGLSTDGDLYTLNIEEGGVKREQKWTRFPTQLKLRDVSFGQDHLLMLATNGELYAIGDNTDGQCGVKTSDAASPDGTIKVQTPVKVAFPHDKRIAKIYSKFNQNVVVAEDGDVFAFGNNNRMQLGFASEFSRYTNPLLRIEEPKSFKETLDSANCHLIDVVLGEDFSLFHCINKLDGLTQIYGMGSSSKGQLANGRFESVANFEPINALSNLTIETSKGEAPLGIKRLACGRNHCLALIDMDGPLLIWGNNDVGQIGNRDNIICDKPKIVSPLKHSEILDLFVDDTTTAVYSRPRPAP